MRVRAAMRCEREGRSGQYPYVTAARLHAFNFSLPRLLLFGTHEFLFLIFAASLSGPQGEIARWRVGFLRCRPPLRTFGCYYNRPKLGRVRGWITANVFTQRDNKCTLHLIVISDLYFKNILQCKVTIEIQLLLTR